MGETRKPEERRISTRKATSKDSHSAIPSASGHGSRKRRIPTRKSTSKEPQPSTIPASSWCISYQQLMDVDQEIRKKHGAEKYAEMTMRDISREIIEPRCTREGASYALSLNPQGLPVDTFVSHCWDGHFHALVQAIRNIYQTCVIKPNLWICAFALLQSQRASVISEQVGSKQDPLELSPFVMAIQSASSYLIVRNSRIDVFSRIWCVAELMYAWQSKLYPLRTNVTGPDAFGKLRTSVLDAQSSMLADRDRILKVLFTEFDREKIDEIVHQLRTHDTPHYPDDDDDTQPLPVPPPRPTKPIVRRRSAGHDVDGDDDESSIEMDELTKSSKDASAPDEQRKNPRRHGSHGSKGKRNKNYGRSKSLDRKELKALIADSKMHSSKSNSMQQRGHSSFGKDMNDSKVLDGMDRNQLRALVADGKIPPTNQTMMQKGHSSLRKEMEGSSKLLDSLAAFSLHGCSASANNNNPDEAGRREKLQRAVSGLGKYSDHVSSSARPKDITRRVKLQRAVSDFGKMSDELLDSSCNIDSSMSGSMMSGSMTDRRSLIKDTFSKLGETHQHHQSRARGDERKPPTTRNRSNMVSPVRMPSRKKIGSASRRDSLDMHLENKQKR